MSTALATKEAADSKDLFRLPPRAWLLVGLLCLVGCLNYLDRIMLTTMRDSVKAAIPMTDSQFGLLTSVFLWVYGMFSPFAGFLADRLSRSRVIIGSLLLWSITTWLTSYATTFNQLLLTRAVMGLSEACYLPAALALITDYHRGPTRSLAIGIHLCGVSIGSGLGGLGGWLAEHHGWSFAFSLFGLIGIAYSVVVAIFLRDAPRLPVSLASSEPTSKQVGFFIAIKTLFASKSFLILLIHWSLMGLAGWGVIGWMPTYLQQQFTLSQTQAGFTATGFLQLSTLAGLLTGGALADRWSRSDDRGRQFIAIAGMCLAAPAIFLTATTPFFYAAIGGLLIFGFARAWTDGNTMPILCTVCDPRYRATGFGILNLFACLVGGITIYAGGMLRDAQINVRHIFEFSAGALVICAILLLFIRPVNKYL